jgi:hypothetical protein
MSDFVENLARAYNPVGWAWYDSADADHPAKPIFLARERKQMRDAIEAMREPTEKLWQAWRSVNCKIGENGMEEFTYFAGDYGNWLACHHAMIDSALKSSDECIAR